MSRAYGEPLPVLMVSAKLMRSINALGASVRDAFDAARAFAETLLPRALSGLDAIGPLLVAHCDSLMVIVFDKRSERFCIVGFYNSDGEPTPPDGPGTRERRPYFASDFLDALGLATIVPAPAARGSRFGERLAATRNGKMTAAAELLLRVRREGREDPAISPLTLERDLPKSRSICFKTSSTAPGNGLARALLDDCQRILFSVHRRSGAPVDGRPAA